MHSLMNCRNSCLTRVFSSVSYEFESFLKLAHLKGISRQLGRISGPQCCHLYKPEMMSNPFLLISFDSALFKYTIVSIIILIINNDYIIQG